jgi:multidrug efflux system membrane fusion protein
VQQGPDGAYVWTLGKDDRAAMSAVVSTRIETGKALIEKGLTAGQVVVVDGQYNLKPGSRVTPTEPPTAFETTHP